MNFQCNRRDVFISCRQREEEFFNAAFESAAGINKNLSWNIDRLLNIPRTSLEGVVFFACSNINLVLKSCVWLRFEKISARASSVRGIVIYPLKSPDELIAYCVFNKYIFFFESLLNFTVRLCL